MKRFGRRLQAMTEGKKHYEILGFDPRGISNTTPRVDCFGESHVLARDLWMLEKRGIGGNVGISDSLLPLNKLYVENSRLVLALRTSHIPSFSWIIEETD